MRNVKMWLSISLYITWMIHFTNGRDFMLPGDVIPSHYDIQLLYDIDPMTNFSFYGVVDILFKSANTTSKIVLHAKGLHVLEEKVKLIIVGHKGPTKGLNIDVAVHHDPEDINQFLILNTNKELQINEVYSLSIPFYGNLNFVYVGAHVIGYTNKKTKTEEYYVVGFFEPIFARRAFPCFDEPQYKATFKLTIGHHKDYHALSNMPIEDSTKMSDKPFGFQATWTWDVSKYKNDFVWDHFGKSVTMSTYHLTYVVSKFHFVDCTPPHSKTKLKIWASNDDIHLATHAASITPKILSYFEIFFNITYALPKLDQVALHVMAAAGFEGWGLIIYLDRYLLYDEKLSDLPLKRMHMEVISHEIAHQWFGNLVTMKWWNELWLKEGFAEFMADLAMKDSWPEIKDVHIVDTSTNVFAVDALKSSRSVTAPLEVTSPQRIPELYDAISYGKGYILLRMLYQTLGDKIFREAVHKYLTKYSYKSTVEDDLWEAFAEPVLKNHALPGNVTVARVMSAWISQSGYPVITVLRDYKSNSLSIYQDHFSNEYYAYAIRTRRSSKSWWVPLSVLAQRDQQTPSPITWLADDQGIEHPHRYQHAAGEDEWLLFNFEMTALCRVNYDSRNWAMLIATLTNGDYTTIPVLSRVQLVSDAFAFAWTARESYKIALELASYLHREEDYRPLESGLTMLDSIGNLFRRSSDFHYYQKYVRSLIEETYEKVGGLAKKKVLRGDNYNSVKMQRITSTFACRVEIPACEEHAMEMFQEWMDTPDPDNNNPMPQGLQQEILSAKTYQSLRRCAMGDNGQQLFSVILNHSPNSTLEMTVAKMPESIMGESSMYVITNVITSSVGFYVAKDFIYDESDKLFERFPNLPMLFLKTLLHQFTTYHELREFTSWRDRHVKMLEASTKNIEQGIERAQLNLEWLERNREDIIDNLKQFTEYSSARKMKKMFLKQSNDANKVVIVNYLFCLLCLMWSINI